MFEIVRRKKKNFSRIGVKTTQYMKWKRVYFLAPNISEMKPIGSYKLNLRLSSNIPKEEKLNSLKFVVCFSEMR